LIIDRHRWRVDWRHAGAVKRQPAAGAGKRAEDPRLVAQDIFLKDFAGVAIEPGIVSALAARLEPASRSEARAKQARRFMVACLIGMPPGKWRRVLFRNLRDSREPPEVAAFQRAAWLRLD
jgi:hypothetical protein